MVPLLPKLGLTWQNSEVIIIAPTLFYYEVTNVFYRMNRAKMLTKEDMEKALQDCLNLGIVFYGNIQIPQLHQKAIEIAQKLQLPATYDAHYLALSDYLKTDFYTADKKLYNSVNSIFSWVHLITLS